MKYTKDFEKYWLNSKATGKIYGFEDTKIIAFRAWKAGIEKTKRDYCLIKPRDESPKFLPF